MRIMERLEWTPEEIDRTVQRDLIEKARELTEPCPVCGEAITDEHELGDHLAEGWGSENIEEEAVQYRDEVETNA